MKRSVLLKHLKEKGCKLHREGGNHTMFINPVNGKTAAVPRHPDVREFLAFDICKQLDIPKPKIN
jgi:predicted RNA binding protein YcfA (HicA-like mRNA interferase family)